MRYTEFRAPLVEGLKQSLQMYNGIEDIPEKEVENFIRDVTKTFRKQDRVAWFVRWHRIHLLNKMHERDEDTIPEKTKRKYMAAVDMRLWVQAVHQAEVAMENQLAFKHYLDLPIEAIDNLVWQRQSPTDLLSEMEDLAEEWQSNIEDRTVEVDENEVTRFIDFPEDEQGKFAWFDLHRGGCREEARAMGHCGNGGGGHGETILSLRRHVHEDRWEPCLTFISKDGHLGEMKGRGNEKPAPRYHKYILALLLNDRVKGIRGGGYMPENNFSLKDLPDGVRSKLMTRKPDLIDPPTVAEWYLYGVPEGVKLSKEGFRKLAEETIYETVEGISGVAVYSEGEEDIVAVEVSYIGAPEWERVEEMDEDYLADELEEVGYPRATAEYVGEKFVRDYRDKFLEWVATEIYSKDATCKDAVLTVKVTWGMVFEEAFGMGFDNEDDYRATSDHIYEYLFDLNPEYKSSDVPGTGNLSPSEAALAASITSGHTLSNHPLSNNALHTMVEMVGMEPLDSPHHEGTPTQNHPDQLTMDLDTPE